MNEPRDTLAAGVAALRKFRRRRSSQPASPAGRVGQTRRLTSISIAGEVSTPLHVCASHELSRSHREQSDGAQNAAVRELWRGGDDAVGDVVVDRLRCDQPQ